MVRPAFSRRLVFQCVMLAEERSLVCAVVHTATHQVRCEGVHHGSPPLDRQCVINSPLPALLEGRMIQPGGPLTFSRQSELTAMEG
jgi:hypothetical protein